MNGHLSRSFVDSTWARAARTCCSDCCAIYDSGLYGCGSVLLRFDRGRGLGAGTCWVRCGLGVTTAKNRSCRAGGAWAVTDATFNCSGEAGRSAARWGKMSIASSTN